MQNLVVPAGYPVKRGNIMAVLLGVQLEMVKMQYLVVPVLLYNWQQGKDIKPS